MLKNKKLLYALLITAVLLALWWLYMLNKSNKTLPEASINASNLTVSKPALTVDLVRPTLILMNLNLTANGSIAPWQEAIIGAEVSGLMLNSVNVNVGDTVKRGQLLAQFSSNTTEADIAQANANLNEAKASAIEAAGNASRARSIADTGALSVQTIAQLVSLEATTSARVAANEATLLSQQLRLKQTKVIAPDDGIISARSATVGAVTSAGQELFKLIRQGRLEWRAELTSADINKISNGMLANITLPDSSFISGKVRTASPMVDNQTRNAMVFVDLPKNGKAKAGMFARGDFEIGQKEALSLPATALLMKDGFAYVMQVDAKKRIKQIKIQTGSRQGSQVEIIGLESLQNSDFVASGAAFLADGDLVNIANQTSQNTAKTIIKNTGKE